MNKIDLTDVTFTIPIKLESQERLDNLRRCLTWLQFHYDTNVIIMEADNEPRLGINKLGESIKYYYHKNSIFHRTRYLNEMCLISRTPFVANYDVDVLFSPKQIFDAVELLRSGDLDGVFPYDRHFVDASIPTIEKVFKTMSLDVVDVSKEKVIGYNSANKTTGVAKGASVGGCIIWNKKKFIEGGMENENFVSYGYEDNERVDRFEKLGYKLGRVKGDLIHMTHPRGNDSYVTNPYFHSNRTEFERIKNMSSEQVRYEINTW